jgi:hypothetical protein
LTEPAAGIPAQQAKELPRAALWREFTGARDSHLDARRAAAEVQRESERSRRARIRDAFVAQRNALRTDVSLRPSARRAAVSVARMERVSQEAALREAISVEREAFRSRYGDARGPSFSAFLQGRAQAGDERALAELRRTKPALMPSADITDERINHIMPAGSMDPHGRTGVGRYNEILFRAPTLTWKVHENGDVTYRLDDRDVVRDLGADVRVLQMDRDAIEAGLRLAQAKFGNTLQLVGPEAFRVEAARVAADAGLRVEFTDDSLNRVMQQRRVERVAQRADTVAAREVNTPLPVPARPSPDAAVAPSGLSMDAPTR